ncbi:hypothetical protein NBRC116494_06700 [Aurantivibrio plasticivorans]
MSNRPKDQNKSFPLKGNEDLKTQAKASQNRKLNAAVIRLVKALARQAAEEDFKAQHKLH